ncbi:MAG: hypothetical protein SFV22_04595 [Saprospiraceae bacterium]|nr:hypothetical protein [Saprospiraceae bacterium]
MKKSLVFLFCLWAGLCASQTVIETKFGVFFPDPTYTYNGLKFHPTINPPGMGLALGVTSGLGKKFTLGTELGFVTFRNSLDIEMGNFRVNGEHFHQRFYAALVPQFNLLQKQDLGRVFISAGPMLIMESTSEINSYTQSKPFDVGNIVYGSFAGIGANAQLGKIGVQLEYRYAFRTSTKDLRSIDSPDQFSLRYGILVWSLTHHLN